MTLLKALTFESGALTGTDAFDAESAINATHSATTADPILGTHSYRIVMTGAASQVYGQLNISSTATLYTAFYFRMSAIPSDTVTIFNHSSGDEIRLLTNGTLRIYRGFALRGSASAVLAVDTVYRVEIAQDGSGVSLSIAEGDGAATLVATDATGWGSTSSVRYGSTASSSATTTLDFDEIHLDNASMPTLPGFGSAAVDVAARGGMTVGGRVGLTVKRAVVSRGGAVVGGRVSLSIQKPVAGRGGVIVGGRLTLQTGAITTDIAARGGLSVGGRIAIAIRREITLRGGVIVGGRVPLSLPGDLAPRGGVVVGGRLQLAIVRHVEPRGGMVVGGRLALRVTRTIKLRGGIFVGGRDAYVGPGTGIVVQGVRDPISVVREGDTFRIFFPFGGLQGVNALAHVASRSVRDDRDMQELELSLVPTPDPALVPRQAGGVTPAPGADQQDLARTVSRQGREQDRLQRKS